MEVCENHETTSYNNSSAHTSENGNKTCDEQQALEANQSTHIILGKLTKWSDYESFGQPLSGVGIIPMKTPINEDLVQSVKHSFTLQSFIDAHAKRGIDIGLVVDLTSHTPLYDLCLPHKKITCISKEYVESESIAEFNRIVTEFRRANPDKYVAVHCGYGFNRTGFVVCSHMVESHGMSIDEALSRFASARPPGIRHGHFIEELQRRYAAVGTNGSNVTSDADADVNAEVNAMGGDGCPTID